MWWLIGIGVLIYLIGVGLDVSTQACENFKFHEGGFLNMGYTTHDDRDITPHDIRFGLLWPIRLFIYFVGGVLWIMHDFIRIALLTFNIRYGNTKLYKKIDKFFDRIL